LVPEFYLRKSPQITERLFKRIEEHFNRLGLFGRFESASNSIVSEIRKSILGSRLVFTRNQKKKIVLREVNIKKQVYGINNWRTALIEGLSTSSEFLDSISSSYRVGTPKWVRDKILGVP
jgi:plasmid stabilization system protein ParE